MTRITKTITILLLILSLFALCSCENKADDEANIPTTEELIASQYDELTTQFDKNTEPEKIVSYVSDWAVKNEIFSYTTADGILVMKKDPSKGYIKEKSKVLLCSVNGRENDLNMQYLATLMYTFDNLGKHGTTYGVVVPEGKIESLPEEITSCDEFINLEYSEKDALITSCAASSEYELSSSCKYKKPRFETAYKISIKGLEGGEITDAAGSHPNAMLNISSFLANLNSGGFLYDLAYLRGGSGYDKYSKSAKAVIVISENEEEKFEKKMDKAIEKFDKKWKDKQPEAEYTYEKIKIPSSVIESEDCDNLVSVLYTMITGTYLEDEKTGDIIAYSNIGKVSVKNGKMKVKVKAFSKNKSTLTEMNDSIKTLSKMSGFKPHKTDSSKLWEEDPESDFMVGIKGAADAAGYSLPEASSLFRTHECALIKEKNSNAHLISMGTGFENWSGVSETIKTYVGTKSSK